MIYLRAITIMLAGILAYWRYRDWRRNCYDVKVLKAALAKEMLPTIRPNIEKAHRTFAWFIVWSGIAVWTSVDIWAEW